MQSYATMNPGTKEAGITQGNYSPPEEKNEIHKSQKWL